jgi:rhodanese-related sulfurtransferase
MLDLAHDWRVASEEGDLLKGAKVLGDLAAKEREWAHDMKQRSESAAGMNRDRYQRPSDSPSRTARDASTTKLVIHSKSVDSDSHPQDQSSQRNATLIVSEPIFISVHDAHRLWEKGAYYLDCRSEDDFAAGHVKFATHLSSMKFLQFPDDAYDILDSIPESATLIVYGSGQDDYEEARHLRYILVTHGYSDVLIMNAEIGKWASLGYPCEFPSP